MQMLQWINCFKELPPKSSPISEMSSEVLVSLRSDEVSIDRYSFKYSMWIAHPAMVTHWMHKPKPADKDNE